MTHLKSTWTSFKVFTLTKPFFWKLFSLLKIYEFYGFKLFFSSNAFLKIIKEANSTEKVILKSGRLSVLIGFILFITTENLGMVLKSFMPDLYEVIFSRVEAFLPQEGIREESIDSLLSAISGVSGVFLGLYFTSLSFGAGKYHPSIRKLFLSEKVGSQYITMLAILTIYSFLLWSKFLFIDSLSLVSLVTLILYTIFLVAAFFPLGKRTFFLAEPNELAREVFIESQRILKQLESQNIFSTYKSVEQNYHLRIQHNLSLLEKLLSESISLNSKGIESATAILRKLYTQIAYYNSFKNRISSESQWFKSVPKFNNWLRPDPLNERLLESQGLVLPVAQQVDRDWLGNAVNRLTSLTLEGYAKNASPQGFTTCVMETSVLLGSMAQNWELTQAIDLNNIIRDQFIALCSTKVTDEQELSICSEQVILVKLNTLQSLSKNLEDLNIEDLLNSLTRASKSRRDIKSVHIPSSIRVEFEQVRKKLHMEHEVEGRILTPDWYILEVFASIISRELIKLYDKIFPATPISGYLSEGLPSKARAILLIREHQCFKTSEATLYRIETLLEKLDHFKRSNHENFKLPSDISKIALINRWRESIYLELVYTCKSVFHKKRSESDFGYFGTLYQILMTVGFDTIVDKNSVFFLKLYPELMVISFLAVERSTQDNSQIEDLSQKLLLSFEPLDDLLTLSFYAYHLFNTSGQEDTVNQMMQTWDRPRKGSSFLSNKTDLIKWLLAHHKLRRSSIYGFRGTRTSWKQRFAELIQAEATGDKHFHDPQGQFIKSLANHFDVEELLEQI